MDVSLSELQELVMDREASDGQCCDSWGHKVSDTTEQQNWTESRFSCPNKNISVTCLTEHGIFNSTVLPSSKDIHQDLLSNSLPIEVSQKIAVGVLHKIRKSVFLKLILKILHISANTHTHIHTCAVHTHPHPEDASLQNVTHLLILLACFRLLELRKLLFISPLGISWRLW